jgi:tyrosyl-tRNA synthetase
MPAMTNILALATTRGFLQDATPGLEARLAIGPVSAYVGFDPTADSLHIGNLVPVMGLAWLQRTGGTPVILVGGGTGLVGDPSGKRAERPMLPQEQIDANAARLKAQLERFVDFTGPTAARVVNNAEWLRPLRLLEFLRDTGKHFTVNYMLQKDAVKSRMDAGISFTEFSYMLVQAHDYWHLNRSMQVELQMGGSDQWGNITAGIELVARREQRQVHGLTFPLITTASGAKFGKSDDGNIWLDPEKTSPYQFYQYWLNADDRDVGPWLRLFTFMDLTEIDEILAEQSRDPGRRAAQRRLAHEVTARVHGGGVADRVVAASAILFGGTELRAATGDVLEVLEGEVPKVTISSELAATLTVGGAILTASLATSKADVRRGVEQGAFSINGERVTDASAKLTEEHRLAGRYVVLQKGKKTYSMLVVD